MEQKNNTIWVLPIIEGGVVNQIVTNAPKDKDVRCQVIDYDTDYEDRTTMEIQKDRIERMIDEGQLRAIEDTPYWGPLDEETCTYTERYTDNGEYTFIQIWKRPCVGGFMIAYTDEKPICIEDYSRDERLAAIGKAGLDVDDERFNFDDDLEGVYAALYIFRANIEEYIVPNLLFDTFHEAQHHLALHYLDCFVAPDIDYTGTQQPAGCLPLCVDAERALRGFDKDTLICVALAYERYVMGKARSIPVEKAFRLELFLSIHSTVNEIKELASYCKSSVFRKELDQMAEDKLVDLLLKYNHYLMRTLWINGDINGVEDLQSFANDVEYHYTA